MKAVPILAIREELFGGILIRVYEYLAGKYKHQRWDLRMSWGTQNVVLWIRSHFGVIHILKRKI